MNYSIIKPALFLLAIAAMFGSCKEDKLDTFQDDTSIYFSLQRAIDDQTGIFYYLRYPLGNKIYTDKWERIKNPMDSIVKSYGYIEKGLHEIDTLFVPASIMGNVFDFERPIGFKIGENTTALEGTDFRIVSATIPANQTLGAIAIEIQRKSFKDVVKNIDFELIPNEYFQTNFKYTLRFKNDTLKANTLKFRLVISDFLTTPPRWNIYGNYFGTFSAKKLFLVASISNIKVADFYDTSSSAPALSYMIALASIFKKYLAEQKAAGNTVYEEDGITEMTAGKSA